eukprot:TRINITY_DN11275_c0_g1::TRINITY_DN11275_c0_g1_i1::g.762::m.762 TRINITY_DN11275_c0_g1::TRINITY_DN11275_c0_g1_i1::g.762  ORF type:complete len:1066 (+),score=268.88,sp/P54673/PI3K1_DICDI/38.97/0.0,PI3Ka/PF00613.15/6.2e-59,PI3_PI4_kinase/PF00454.22/2.1e-50,PI3K_C2/PF00792.19/5.8e+02,PI3K_C2/PF00792.19/4.8e-25,PI3K_rbd/PF00794.13/0.00056,PI3K_rbd/PF00794.13/5.8e-13,HEAT_2/PF13646.1/0.14 TRINITY_DN11275_c0_g1_i1:311-3199(+)
MDFFKFCEAKTLTPKMALVKKSGGGAEIKRKLDREKEILMLLGQGSKATCSEEELHFRRTMRRIRLEEISRQAQKERHPLDLPGITRPTLGPRPANLADKFIMLCTFPGGEMTKKIMAKGNQRVSELMQDVLGKTRLPGEDQAEPLDSSAYVFKVTGYGEYLDGDHELWDYRYIRQCLMKSQSIELSVTPRKPLVDAVRILEEEIAKEEATSKDLEELLGRGEAERNYDAEVNTAVQTPEDSWTCIPIWKLKRRFRLRIRGVENLKDPPSKDKSDAGKKGSVREDEVYVQGGLYSGGEQLGSTFQTEPQPFSKNPRWSNWLTTSVDLCDLPRAARMCFTVFRTEKKGQELTPLGCVNILLFDFNARLRTGTVSCRMWENERANPIGTCVENLRSIHPPQLFVELDTYPLDVVYPSDFAYLEHTMSLKLKHRSTLMDEPSSKDKEKLDRIVKSDPLEVLDDASQQLITRFKHILRVNPAALPKYLLSVKWQDPCEVLDACQHLDQWAAPSPDEALELLDAKFAHERVREYAVKCLERLSDEELSEYLLQLIQVLKYEPYHDSSLARFLMRRALRCPDLIGHQFFWHMKAEMHVAEISERFGLLIEEYLRACGIHRKRLSIQNQVMEMLVGVANHIKTVSTAERLTVLRDKLAALQFPASFELPLDARFQCCGLKVEKCKYMDSKKLPLWLVFRNADPLGKDLYVIFKAGDDLRQDMLTLQMLRIMDNIWQREGLDLKLIPYGCVATGNEIGMLQVVLNSDTTANIAKEAGGATAVWQDDIYSNWLRGHNPSDTAYQAAVENFLVSCSGYCVATYVLGIGDRHNDNIMLRKDGNLFHIDFGHFLGNFKSKFGVKRERAPFVFTNTFAHVLGGPKGRDFGRFVELSCKAYNILRKHTNLFMTLFALMLSTGIPELRDFDDLLWLRHAFEPELAEPDASKKFTKLIHVSLTTKATDINNAIHILAH